MGRFRGMGEADDDEAGIEMSPLIDCVFILLIFFIVTTTFVEERGIEVDKPQASASLGGTERTNVLISLTENGEVFSEGVQIGIGGVRPLVQQALRVEEIPVIVEAAPAVSTALLMRVVDEAKLGGSSKVSVTTRQGGRQD